MKKLSIEQKAKAYDEAIERIREWSETKNGYYMPKELCEEIFHELCESEDDRVRKAMIDFFKHEREEGITVLHYGVNIERMIAWLEKQTSNADNANKEYWRGYREGKQVILDKYAELEKQGEQKPYGQRKECEDCQFNYAGECKGYCTLKRNEQKPTDKVEPKFKKD